MSENNILKNISKFYFQGIADDITNSKLISSVYPNMSDRGDIRENVLLKFLQSHLPSRCVVEKGGFVFDSKFNESKQIDLLVVNESSIRFSYFDRDSKNNKTFQTIEGCLVAISVKSTLNEREIYDALRNLSTIPQMPAEIADRTNLMIDRSKNSYLNFPLKVIFAFDGQGVDTMHKHIENFYKENNCQLYQKADLIIVNNKFCIERIHRGGERATDGSTIPEGVFYKMSNKNEEKFGAYPLLRLLIKIHGTTNWTPYVSLTYQHYLNSMDFF